MNMTTLEGSQVEIAQEIINADFERLTLAGLAGTGKTTVARAIYEAWTSRGLRTRVLAPTGKASMVLRSKGVPATTIHQAIYHYKGKFETIEGELEILFQDNRNGRFCDRLIIDEGSMVTRRQLDDIMSRGIPSLFVGDPGQLPPVKSAPTNLFTKPNYVLREIHRQAKDSPIIQFAHKLRQGGKLTDRHPGIDLVDIQGKGPTAVAWEMQDRSIDRIIVKTNAQRVALNKALRGITNRRGVVTEGDEIICIMNNKQLDTVNGEIFEVLNVIHPGNEATEVELRSIDTGAKMICDLWNEQFGQEQKLDTDEIDPAYMLADYAYAITCHKFQGSSARSIGITAKGYCGDDDRRWNYTAATRAEQEITVFC